MDFGIVAFCHMLDNGKPQTCAAGCPAVALVHPVKPLKNPLLMLRRNADAGVADRKAVVLEGHGDGAVDPVVANGVVH